MPEFTLSKLAEKCSGEVVGNGDVIIRGTAKLETAGEGDIAFLTNPRYKDSLKDTRATAVIIDKKIQVESPIPTIRAEDAYYWFLQFFLLFNPPQKLIEPGVHPTAVVDSSAKLGDEVAVGAGVVIGKKVSIGRGTRILPGGVVMDGVSIGEDCLLYPLVSVRENCSIGSRVIIHNGAVIGSDGFGFAPQGGVFHKIPQVGRVIIEDDVEIGANCTLDRGSLGDTIVRRGAKLDNLVHLAHNVEVGESTVMAAQAGISGSTKIGHHVMVGGQVGTVGHIRIGDFAQIGAQSGVSKNVPEKEIVFGYPARPIMRTKRIEAVINQLPELMKRIRELEKEVEKLRGGI